MIKVPKILPKSVSSCIEYQTSDNPDNEVICENCKALTSTDHIAEVSPHLEPPNTSTIHRYVHDTDLNYAFHGIDEGLNQEISETSTDNLNFDVTFDNTDYHYFKDMNTAVIFFCQRDFLFMKVLNQALLKN